MIKNRRQLNTIKARADRLAQLADELDRRLESHSSDARTRIETKAVHGELKRMRTEIEEYEALEAGRTPVGAAESVDDIPRVLIRARIAAGLSQEELAEKLGLHQQQIQRYEANDYRGASLARLADVARALGVRLSGADATLPDLSRVLRRLDTVGLDRRLVLDRIAPPSSAAGGDDPAVVLSLAGRLSRVFGWQPEQLIDDTLEADWLPAAAAGFKASKSTSDRRLIAYTCYAHFLAKTALQATEGLGRGDLPASAEDVRAQIERLGGMTLGAAVQYAWSKGVVVLPLLDKGAFHAAYWRIGGRSVVVLKQRRRTQAIWLFDLLHELAHACESPDRPEREIIELKPEDPSRRDTPAERSANAFASRVLLGDPDRLFELVWSKSQGGLGRLKRTVALVARHENVDVEALAYHVAHVLQSKGIDWWAAANTLQHSGEDPWARCRDAFLAHADLTKLAPLDRELLIRALSEPATPNGTGGEARS